MIADEDHGWIFAEWYHEQSRLRGSIEGLMNQVESERLRLELMSENDAELLYQLDQDPEVMRYINGGHMTTREEIRDVYIPRIRAYTDTKRGWGLWKIVVKADGEYIGWILVRPMNFFSEHRDDDNIELGWRLMRKAWGNGYATEAASVVMETLESAKICTQFTAIVMEENLASINVMKKLGMKYTKTELHSDPLGDVVVAFYQRACGN